MCLALELSVGNGERVGFHLIPESHKVGENVAKLGLGPGTGLL